MQHTPTAARFLCMHTSSLVPTPKTMVIGAGARQVHKQNRNMTSRHYAQLTRFLPVGKAYEHHIGKMMCCIQPYLKVH